MSPRTTTGTETGHQRCGARAQRLVENKSRIQPLCYVPLCLLHHLLPSSGNPRPSEGMRSPAARVTAEVRYHGGSSMCNCGRYGWAVVGPFPRHRAVPLEGKKCPRGYRSTWAGQQAALVPVMARGTRPWSNGSGWNLGLGSISLLRNSPAKPTRSQGGDSLRAPCESCRSSDVTSPVVHPRQGAGEACWPDRPRWDCPRETMPPRGWPARSLSRCLQNFQVQTQNIVHAIHARGKCYRRVSEKR